MHLRNKFLSNASAFKALCIFEFVLPGHNNERLKFSQSGVLRDLLVILMAVSPDNMPKEFVLYYLQTGDRHRGTAS